MIYLIQETTATHQKPVYVTHICESKIQKNSRLFLNEGGAGGGKGEYKTKKSGINEKILNEIFLFFFGLSLRLILSTTIYP